jgi:hypothetical protein
VRGCAGARVRKGDGLGKLLCPEAVTHPRITHLRTRAPGYFLLIRYPSMIVPYFTSMFGTSHSGSLPSRR